MELVNVLIFVLLGVMLGGSLVFILLHRAHRRSIAELSDKLVSLERGFAEREPDGGRAHDTPRTEPTRAPASPTRSATREVNTPETPATEAARHAPISPSAAALPATSPTMTAPPTEPDPALGPAFIPLPRMTAAHTPAAIASRNPVPSPPGGSALPAPSGGNVLPATARAPLPLPPQRLQNTAPTVPLAVPNAPTASSVPAPSAAAIRAATAAASTVPSVVPSKPIYPPLVPGTLVAPPMPGLTPPEEPAPIRLSIPPLPEARAYPNAAQVPVYGGAPFVPAPFAHAPSPPSSVAKRPSAAASFAGGMVPAPRSTQEPSTLVEHVRDQDPELSRLLASSRARLEPTQQSALPPRPPTRAEPSQTEQLPRARRPMRADDEVTQLDPLEPSMLAKLQGGPEPAVVHAVEPSGPKRVFEEPALPARVAANGEIVRGAEARTRVTEIESNADPHATSDAWVWAPPPEIDSMLGEFARGVDDPATTSPRHVLPAVGPSWPPKKT